jgi:hypothetical protein
MKNAHKLRITAFVLVFIITVVACNAQSGGRTINSATELKQYLDSQSANTPDKPIRVSMGVNGPMIKDIAKAIAGKYVYLTLTGSVLPIIPEYGFSECTNLVGITIPDSVTSIGNDVFYGCTGLTARFLEVLRPLATLMSNYESVPPQERRDKYDDILKTAMTAQPTIIRIFTIWKRNALDGMDSRYIGRPGSTATGQYAMTCGRDNGPIEVYPNLIVDQIMTRMSSANDKKEWVENPSLFKVNGQDAYIVII